MEPIGDPAARTASRVRDHLANERTFLAWLRTSLALIGLGFVLARMGLFLDDLQMHGGRAMPEGGRWEGHPFIVIGVVVLTLGIVLSGWSAWLYDRTCRAIDTGDYQPAWRSVIALSALVVIAGLGIAWFVLRGIMVRGEVTP